MKSQNVKLWVLTLRKDIKKKKALNLRFAKGSETLDEIIKVQCSPLIKTGLGYTEETSQAQKPSTSKSYLEAARRSEQVDNRQQTPNGDHQVNQGQFTSRMNKGYQVNQGQSASRINRSYNQPQVNHS